MQRTCSDYSLEQMLLVPLDKYPSLSVLMSKSYFPPGLSVPVPLRLVYFAFLVDLAAADFRPSISEFFRIHSPISGGT